MFKNYIVLITAFFIASILTSCAVTTDTTESSSETFEHTSEASTELTSSTSPQSDEEAEEAKLIKFVETNFAKLRADIAVGEGEYLTTLAVLLDIDKNKKEQFYSLTKSNFDKLFLSPDTTAKQFIANLNNEITKANI